MMMMMKTSYETHLSRSFKQDTSMIWFYGISTIVGYLMPDPFLCTKTIIVQTIWFIRITGFFYTQINIKTVLLQTIQFSIQKLFISSNLVCRNTQFKYQNSPIQTLPSKPIHFSIVTQFCFIWPYDRTLSGATTEGRNEPGSERYSVFLKAPALPESHHQIIEYHIQDSLLRSITPLQRSSQCILQPPPTEQKQDTEENLITVNFQIGAWVLSWSRTLELIALVKVEGQQIPRHPGLWSLRKN